MHKIMKKIFVFILSLASISPSLMYTQDAPKKSVWEIFAPIGKEALCSLAIGVKTVGSGVISVTGEILSYCGKACIFQAKKHPKALCLITATAALTYGIKASYSSLLHAWHVVHGVENELNTMQSEGNYLVPEHLQKGGDMLNWVINDLSSILTRGEPQELLKIGLCLCPGLNIIQRLNDAIEKRKQELEDLAKRLSSCRFVGKEWYNHKISTLDNRINAELARTLTLKKRINSNFQDILHQFSQFNGLTMCNKRYCKQQICLCEELHPASGCPVHHPQS